MAAAPLTRTPTARWSLAALALLLGLAVVAIREVIARWGALPGDWAVAFRRRVVDVPEDILRAADAVAAAASPLVALTTVVAGALVVARLAGRRHGAGVLVASGVIVANALLKVLFGPTRLHTALSGYDTVVNYPSGHVSYATAVFGFLAYVALVRRGPAVAVLAALVVVAMGPARVVTGAHLPSDVLGGYLLGAAWLIATILWVTRR